MMQIPNLPNQYMQVAQPQPQSYNAVKIDVHNPSVIAPGFPQTAPAQSQYATPTMPYYEYPQAPVYQYPQASMQPYYMPSQPLMIAPEVTQQAPVQDVQALPPAAAQAIPQQTPVVPEPVVTQAPKQTSETQKQAEAQKPEIVPSAPLEPQVDLNGFISKLSNPDYEIQASAMEEIANMVKDNPQKATELLDVKVIDTLNNVINTDSSKLAGPTNEQIAARQKLMKNETMTDAEKALATTITPMEQAERNKSYAMFTSAILQKLYGDEVAKLTNTSVPLTELPGAVQIVEQLKNNPNPMVRTSAIEALSYIQQPAYKADLNTIFSIAKNDQDPSVKEAADAALAKLAQLSEQKQEAKQADMAPNAAQPQAQAA